MHQYGPGFITCPFSDGPLSDHPYQNLPPVGCRPNIDAPTNIDEMVATF